MIANQVPSLITSTAAAVAARASTILAGGWSIDPEQSTMMISALPPVAVRRAGLAACRPTRPR